VTYQTGYGDATATPRPIKQGLLLHIGTMYDERDGTAGMPEGTRALYAPHREMRV
jgi:hypothetical protein